jgi:hypothetical protein
MKFKKVSALFIAFVLLAALTVPAGARPFLPEAGMAAKRSVTVDIAGYDKQHGPHFDFECIATSGGANTNLDCDDPFPNNEPDIEVNPANALNMVASSNDYGSCQTTHGRQQATWSTEISIEKPSRSAATWTVFDVSMDSNHRHCYSVQHAVARCDAILVSPSRDGGLTWDKVVVIDDGIGCDLSKTQLFNDKEWIVTDNNPSSPFYRRTYITWSKSLRVGLPSPIFESPQTMVLYMVEPQEISGSNGALYRQISGPAMRSEPISVPTII